MQKIFNFEAILPTYMYNSIKDMQSFKSDL